METLKHFVRTLSHILALTFGVFAVMWIGFKLQISPTLILLLPFLVLGGYIYWSARWHAYWAPSSKRVLSKKWTNDSGEEMDTVVEKAIVQAGASVRTETWRLSVYNAMTGIRAARRLIGDDAEFLGMHGIGIWFYIHDRFHAKRNGLVCVDIQTLKWLYHTPRSSIAWVNEGKKPGRILVEDGEGQSSEILLADLTPNS